MLLGKVCDKINREYKCLVEILFKQSRELHCESLKLIQKYYSPTAKRATNEDKIVICMVDGKMRHGGLSDRLRGMISVYKLCEKFKLDFKIYHVSPFLLENYLVPNKIDWSINENDISFNVQDSLPVFCGSVGGFLTPAFQTYYLSKMLKTKYKQIHIYTNAYITDKKEFSFLFHKLFICSDSLQKVIDQQLTSIGGKYISVSLRFVQLLGDFNDWAAQTLNDTEKEKLIVKCITQIEKMHNSLQNYKLLIATDSITFINRILDKDYVYVTPGNPVHIDYNENNSFEIHLKTFLDFFLIANATKIYLLRNGKMYKSGFPKSASMIYNIPFLVIDF